MKKLQAVRANKRIFSNHRPIGVEIATYKPTEVASVLGEVLVNSEYDTPAPIPEEIPVELTGTPVEEKEEIVDATANTSENKDEEMVQVIKKERPLKRRNNQENKEEKAEE